MFQSPKIIEVSTYRDVSGLFTTADTRSDDQQPASDKASKPAAERLTSLDDRSGMFGGVYIDNTTVHTLLSVGYVFGISLFSDISEKAKQNSQSFPAFSGDLEFFVWLLSDTSVGSKGHLSIGQIRQHIFVDSLADSARKLLAEQLGVGEGCLP